MKKWRQANLIHRWRSSMAMLVTYSKTFLISPTTFQIFLYFSLSFSQFFQLHLRSHSFTLILFVICRHILIHFDLIQLTRLLSKLITLFSFLNLWFDFSEPNVLVIWNVDFLLFVISGSISCIWMTPFLRRFYICLCLCTRPVCSFSSLLLSRSCLLCILLHYLIYQTSTNLHLNSL